MTDRHEEGIEKAAEAIGGPRYWQTDMNDARADVTAYLAHAHPVVDSVEELDALPVGTVVMDEHGASTAGEPYKGTRLWDYTGDEIPCLSKDIKLPARVIHWGGDQ